MKTLCSMTILFTLLLSGIVGQELEQSEKSRLQVDREGQAETIRLEDTKVKVGKAAVSMEIILAHLDAGDFQEAADEFNNILALNLRGKYEDMATQSAWNVVIRLLEDKQFEVAHQILDATLGYVSRSDNQFKMRLLKGKVFKDQGEPALALSEYEKARKLKPEE